MKRLVFLFLLSFIFILNCGDKASVSVNVIYYSDANGVDDIPGDIGNNETVSGFDNQLNDTNSGGINDINDSGVDNIYGDVENNDMYYVDNSGLIDDANAGVNDISYVDNVENDDTYVDNGNIEDIVVNDNGVDSGGNNKYNCNELLCLYYEANSEVVIASGYHYNLYQKAVFFTGQDTPYINLEIPAVIDTHSLVAYFSVPEGKVYKFFNLKSWDGWLLVDGKDSPFLGEGLEYFCDEDGCAILISERKNF